jgi:hypothetical protein
MILSRYAGYDPDEDNFDDVEPAPLHDEELRARRRTRINVSRAWELKRDGFDWAEIGRILACEQGRAANYQAMSVYMAANYYPAYLSQARS